jgi:hypothetical protein
MEAAAAAAEPEVARDRARRYLAAFPGGMAAARARQILERAAERGPPGAP